MKKLMLMLLAAMFAAATTAPACRADDEKIPLDKLPENIKKAAEEAVKGLVLTKGEKETKNGVVVYEIEGKVGAKEYDVKISSDGKVLKVEEETDDDDNDDDDDDDEPAAAARKAVVPPAPPKGDF